VSVSASQRYSRAVVDPSALPPGASRATALPDESVLVDALRSGDPAAYEQLVRSQGGPMLAVARRLLRNDDDAKDAVQEAFISAYRGIGRFERGSRLSTWLHRIVVNAALMKLRSRKRRPEESIDDHLPTYEANGHLSRPIEPWPLPADELLAREDVRLAVRAAIDRLPENYRNVLLLRDIEGLDTEEVARMLDVTPNAVKIRLHRARLALRALLDPQVRGLR
jgi:RNA polymerase sigma-70 factor (ECF subfamily)